MTDETQATAPADGEDTSAVLAALSGDKTYLGEPEGEAPPEPAEEPGDDAAAATEEDPPATPVKVKKSAQERINDLTRDKREAEREAEYWRARATQTTPTAPQPPAGDGRPDPADFTDGAYDPAYIDALTDWKAEQAVERRFTQKEAQTRVQSAIEAFDAKVEAEYPDGEPAGITALRRAPVLPQTIVDLVTTSEVGPKLAEHLGDHPRELARLSAMPPHLQGRELAKLEQKLAGPPVISPKTATDAPEPAPTLRGNGGRFKVAGDTQDFAAFEAQYKLGG
jgi:hypothetical protein